MTGILQKPEDWRDVKLLFRLSLSMMDQFEKIEEIDNYVAVWQKYLWQSKRRQPPEKRAKIEKLVDEYHCAADGLATAYHKKIMWDSLSSKR